MAATAPRRRLGEAAVLAKIGPLTLLQVLFLVGPLVLTLMLSFQTVTNYQVAWTWELKTWGTVFGRAVYATVLWNTLGMALMTVGLCVAISLPVAYALVFRLVVWRWPVQILLIFAFLTDQTLKIFGWLLLVEDAGAANYLLTSLELPALLTGFRGTTGAVLLGMVYTLAPFTIFTIALSFANLDRSLVLAAYDAGASRLRAFWSVTLPLALPGILAGAALVFLLAVGAFLEPKVMGAGRQVMMAEQIRQSFETRVNWPLGAALTLLLLVASALVIALAAGTLAAVRRALRGVQQRRFATTAAARMATP